MTFEILIKRSGINEENLPIKISETPECVFEGIKDETYVFTFPNNDQVGISQLPMALLYLYCMNGGEGLLTAPFRLVEERTTSGYLVGYTLVADGE